MNQDMSILHLVLNASVVVQLVMLLLVLVSVASWSAIFRKLFALKRIKAMNEGFERDFWSGTTLKELFEVATKKTVGSGPMERIFASGMREYLKTASGPSRALPPTTWALAAMAARSRRSSAEWSSMPALRSSPRAATEV